MALIKGNSMRVKRMGQRALLAFVVILGLAGATIVVTSADVLRRDIHEANIANLDILAELYTDAGRARLIETVTAAAQGPLGARQILGLFDATGARIAGDMPTRPVPDTPDALQLTSPESGETLRYLVDGIAVADVEIFVGRPKRLVDRSIRNLLIILPLAALSIIAAFVLFLRLAALEMGRLLDRIETALTDFGGGDHGARIPLTPKDDDRFLDVSRHINANLDRVDEARHVLKNTICQQGIISKNRLRRNPRPDMAQADKGDHDHQSSAKQQHHFGQTCGCAGADPHSADAKADNRDGSSDPGQKGAFI